ncbi:MAG: hypothetical protein E7599_07630 [Ruminococcaceae bacterium]|nr:hypothetical protein [Oscillospiraceae bacterium]
MTAPVKKEQNIFVRFAILIIAAAVLFVVGTLAILYFGLGYRYVSYSYERTDGQTVRQVRALLRVDDQGEVLTGNVWGDDGVDFSVDQVRSGYYTVKYSNGDLYEGGLDRLLRSGYGKLSLANGDVYEGNFVENMPSGQGTYTYFNGDKYEGEFRGGKKSGTGVYTWAPVEGEIQRVYEGSFENDMRNGYGVYYYADGSRYSGEFVNDLKVDDNATLIIQNPDGSQDVYVGGFVEDIKSGYGEYRWESGAFYVGEFANDVMEGQGTYTWPGGVHSYTGTFKGNKPYIEDIEVTE